MARLVEEEVNRLDWRALEEVYQGRGSPPYPPDAMLKLVLYEYLTGRSSPAQWARDARDHLELVWLGRGITPSRTACYDFRDRVGLVIQALHDRLIAQALAEGLLDAETGVQDGSIFRANASRHRLVNLETLHQRQHLLQAASDTAAPAIDKPPYWMAKTPGGRQQQTRRFDEAEDVLQQRIAENSRKPKDKRLAQKQIRVSLSDPQAPLGRDKEKLFCPLYTAQVVVDLNSPLVIGWDVFAQATDTGTLPAMIDRVQAVVGGRLKRVLADAAYATVLDLQACRQRNVELIAPVQENSFTEQRRAATGKRCSNRAQFEWLTHEQTYRCPRGHVLSYRGRERKWRRGGQHVIEHRYYCPPLHCQACPLAAQCVRDPSKGRTIKRLEGQELLDAQREKMQRPEIKAIYRHRGPVVERAFADAKQHRQFRRLHGRGLARAHAEIGLLLLAQNIQTLYRLRRSTANRGNQPP